MSQKVAVMVDNLGTLGDGPDEERDSILADLRKEGLDPTLVWYGNRPPVPAEKEIDLLVVDFGALWQIDTTDWTNEVIRWADDHPGSLVLLWSSMTADAVGYAYIDKQDYGHEIEKWAAWPDNVRPLFAGLSYQIDWKEGVEDSDLDWLAQSYSKLQAWFGVDPTRTPAIREVEEAGPLTPPDGYVGPGSLEILPDGVVSDPYDDSTVGTPTLEEEGPTRVCGDCGARVSTAAFSHMHCGMCRDAYTDFKAHAAEPGVKRRHDLGRVVHEAATEAVRGWTDRIDALVWEGGSAANLAQYGAEIGRSVINAVSRQVAVFEQEERWREAAKTLPDTSTLVRLLTAFREWLEADEPQPGGWDHFGFGADVVAVERARGSLHLSVAPEVGRVWVNLAQLGDEMYVRSVRSAGLVNPISDEEVVALRAAFASAGLTITEEWNTNDGVSYVVDATVGPNVAKGRRGGWSAVGKIAMPKGWAA